MNARMLVVCVGMTAYMIIPARTPDGVAQSTSGPVPAQKKGERLSITVWPKTTRVQIRSAFEITLRVVNATEKLQSVKVMSISWDDQWKNDNACVVWAGGILGSGSGNTVETIALEPGESYEKHVQMMVMDGARLIATSFRMGFTPVDEKKTYWSNKVVLGIKPGR